MERHKLFEKNEGEVNKKIDSVIWIMDYFIIKLFIVNSLKKALKEIEIFEKRFKANNRNQFEK